VNRERAITLMFVGKAIVDKMSANKSVGAVHKRVEIIIFYHTEIMLYCCRLCVSRHNV